MYEQLQGVVKTTPIGEVLIDVAGDNCDEFFQRYLHDFVRIVHHCNHRDSNLTNLEYEVKMIVMIIVYLW